jgi:hypothetical protein
MLTSPVGLRSEKGCAGNAQQKLKTTDPTSRQRGHPTSTNLQLSKNNQRKKGKNLSRVPDGCLSSGRTGRLADGLTLTLTLRGRAPCGDGLQYLLRSPARRRKGNPVPGGITGPPCNYYEIIRPRVPGDSNLQQRTTHFSACNKAYISCPFAPFASRSPGQTSRPGTGRDSDVRTIITDLSYDPAFAHRPNCWCRVTRLAIT